MSPPPVELWVRPPGGAWARTGPTQTGTSGAFSYQPTSEGTYSFATRSQDVASNWEWSGTPPANKVVSTAYSGPPPQAKRVTKYYAMGAKRVAMRADSVVYYLHADHLSSTSLVTCGSSGGCNGTPYQGVASRQWYYPYGSVRASVGTLPTDFTYTGQRADATGLMYFRARYYSSSLGRFLSADTMVPSPGNPQSLNRYAYARNNPLKYTDPTGHDACTGTMGTYEPDCGVDGWWGPPIEIWTEAEVNQARAEFTQAFEFIVSMLAEPADYIMTLRDCSQGSCSALAIVAMFAPVVSSKIVRAFAPALESGLTRRLQGAIIDALDEGEIVAVRARPYLAHLKDGVLPAKTAAQSGRVVHKFKNGVRVLDDGSRVVSDMDLAFYTRNGVAMSNNKAKALGRKIDANYRYGVVTHGDNYNGVLMGIANALAVQAKDDVIYVFGHGGFIESGPYQTMVKRYIRKIPQ